MVSGVAFCPYPPLLVPAVAAGIAPELEELRAACRAAITAVAAAGQQLVLLGAGPVSTVHSRSACGSFAGYGVALEVALGGFGNETPGAPIELPLSLTVGAWLVADALGAVDAVAFQIGPDWQISGARTELAALARRDEAALLVLADGSACRSTAAPGYLDQRAAAFDRRVADALAAGDGALLRAPSLDPDGIGEDLWCYSVPVWNEVAPLLGTVRWHAELRYDAAPYGVGYFVASWTHL